MITAVFGGIVTVISTLSTVYLQIKASRKIEVNKTEAIAAREEQNRKLDSVATTVNGHAAEQERKILALHQEVLRLQSPEAQTPPPESGAAVVIKGGVVTVPPVKDSV